MESPDVKVIRTPIGQALVKVGEDVIRTGLHPNPFDDYVDGNT